MEKKGNNVIIKEYLYKYLVQKFSQKKIEGRPLSYLNKDDIKLLKTEKDKFYKPISKIYLTDKKDKEKKLLFIYPKRIIKTRNKLPEPPDSSEELKSSLYSDEEIIFNDFCDVNFTPKEYIINEKIILKDDLIYHYDTNKIILEKISHIMKVPFDEIFAMYKTKNNNLYPIGFNYNQSLIDKNNVIFNTDLTFKKINSDLIDESFVNEIGVPIQNDFINRYDHIFGNNYHINHQRNSEILCCTLKDLIGSFEFSGNEENINNKKLFWGIVNKYFPLIKDINRILKYDSFNSERREMKNLTERYINKLKIQNNEIYEIYSKNVKRNKTNHCTNFKTEFLKISNGDIIEMNNNINIIKLFCDIECDEYIHFMKLSLGKNSSSSYKLNKDKICYKNSLKNLISYELLDKWMKSKILKTENHYLYLFLENNLSIKLHIPVLSCHNIRDKYITLVINTNGRVEVLIDCYISKDDIKIIIEKCNEIIKKINENDYYSEDNISIKLLNNQFLNNLSTTQLDYLECDFLIPLSLHGNKKIIPFNTKEFSKIIYYFDNLFRIENITKSELNLRYKCEDNYNSQQNIRTVITSLKNPDNRKLSDDKIMNEIQESFCINKDFAQKNYDEWIEYFTRKRDSGQNIFLSKETEVGSRINLTQNGSYISVSLKSISSYRQFEQLIYIIETIVLIYKENNGDCQSYLEKKTKCSQSIVDFSERVKSISDESDESDGSDREEEESDSDEPEPETMPNISISVPEKVDEPKSESDEESESSEIDLPHLDEDIELDDEEEEEAEEEEEEEEVEAEEEEEEEEEVDAEDEDESDLSDDFDADEAFAGGGKKGDLNPKKYLSDKLKEFNPEAFGTGFTRRCPNNNYSQPVIITRDELERILDNNVISGPRSFTNIFKSSTIPDLGTPERQTFEDKDLYFICPKYFDIKERLSIKEDIIHNSFIKNLYDKNPQITDKEITNLIMKDLLFTKELANKILNLFKIFSIVSDCLEKKISDIDLKKIIEAKKYDFVEKEKKEYPIDELILETKNMYQATPLSKFPDFYNKVFKDDFKPQEHESILVKRNNEKLWKSNMTQKDMFVIVMKRKPVDTYNAICCGKKLDGNIVSKGNQWKWNKKKGYYYNPPSPFQSSPSPEPISERIPDEIPDSRISSKTQLGEYIKHINRLTPDGEIVFPLIQSKKGVIPPELDKLFNQNYKSVEKDGKGFIRVGIPHNIIPSFISSVYYSEHGTGTPDKLKIFFDEIKTFVSSSLKNFLFLGSGKLSRKVLPQKIITIEDINDFKEFYKSQNKQIKAIYDLKIKDEEFTSLEKFYQNEDPTKIFIFNLFMARNNYLGYLNSDEEMDDYFILPLLENKMNRKFIIFDDRDNSIFIKEQMNINNIDDDDQLLLIFRKKIDDRVFYEPILFFENVNKISDNILHSLNESLKFNSEYDNKKFYKNLNNYSEEYDDFISNDQIKFYYVNSYHEITYVVDTSDFIIPYHLPLSEEYLGKIIFDLRPFIKKTLKDYELIKNLGKFSGLCVSDGIINNIIYKKNNKSYHIPILPEKYDKDLPEYKKFRIYSHYDLNELDNKILLEHNQTNKEYKEIIDNRKNEVEFYRTFYYYLKNSKYEDYFLIDGPAGALKLNNLKRNKFNFLINEDEHEYFGKFIKIYDNPDLNYDIVGFINDISMAGETNDIYDPNTVYSITLEISYLNNIFTILQKIKTISDIRNELREYLMKHVNIDSLNSFSEEQKIRYLNKFIDLILIYKDNELQGFSDIIESDILLNDLPKCSKDNEIIFSSQEYHNGLLDTEFNKSSRFVQNYYNNELDTKPLKKYITNIPNFINKKYPGCLLEVLFENNEIRNIARLLMIDEQEIIKILIERYKLVFDKDNISSVNKIKKYNSSEISNEELLDSIQKPQYELSPIDLTFISEKLGITIYLYSAKYSKNNKYEELIFNDDNEKQILLYHYKEEFDKKITHKLGFITK
tara:strand:+ start:1203 stop:7094 length:5892 start_codon:yes stop_codon:yes gene_type:complete